MVEEVYFVYILSLTVVTGFITFGSGAKVSVVFVIAVRGGGAYPEPEAFLVFFSVHTCPFLLGTMIPVFFNQVSIPLLSVSLVICADSTLQLHEKAGYVTGNAKLEMVGGGPSKETTRPDYTRGKRHL
jgi:hypothetical protein